MAKVKFKLSKQIVLGNAEVLVRFYHSKIDLQAQSHVFVPIADWDTNCGRLAYSTRYMDKHTLDLRNKQNLLNQIEEAILSAYIDTPDNMDRNWLHSIINQCVGVDDANIPNDERLTAAKACLEYTKSKEMEKGTIDHYIVLSKMLERFGTAKYTIYMDSISPDDIANFERFLYSEGGSSRSRNYVSSKLKKFRAVCRWSVGQGITPVSPFGDNRFSIRPEMYGDPVVLTMEEVSAIYAHAMPNPHLERARDIFVFQCHTGQRISDLKRMTYDNIQTIDGTLYLSYIQKKTIHNKPNTVRVPLSNVAKEIIVKYNGHQQKMILPFISDQRYNCYIKEVLKCAGISRMVIVLDSTILKERSVPIYEVATSHLARRTFISSIFEITQEERITVSMTGHASHSSALDRYIIVKDSTKRDAIRKLNNKGK